MKKEELFSLGLKALEQKKYAEAIDSFEAVIEIETDDAEAHYELGLAYCEHGLQFIRDKNYSQESMTEEECKNRCDSFLQKSIEQFKHAIGINPDKSDYHYSLGNDYKELGRENDAIEAFKQTIYLKPDYIDAYVHLGHIYMSQRRLEEALEVLKNIINEKPDSAEPRFLIGLVYNSMQNRSAALEEYTILKELDPELAEKLIDHIYG